MDLINYLASNIPLFSICAVMYFLAIRNIKLRKKEGILFIAFTTIVLFLSTVVTIEKYSQKMGYVELGTIFTSLGYIFRPILLYIFVLLANMEEKRKRRFYIACGLPLAINFIIYMFPLFFGVPGLSTFVFSYTLNPDGTASFVRGGFMNFTSHIVCALYLVVLIYVSTVRFHGKHRRDGLVLILCVVIVTITVIVEMLTNRNDLLNIVCEICAMINYIFIMSVNTSKDPLTDLYDRRTYYEDVARYQNLINGVIEIDMNELKFLNDNYGHSEGDTALSSIARVFVDSVEPSLMCTYRLSGDEFVILMFQGKKEQLEKTVNTIKEKLNESKYSVALGYYFIEENDETTFEEAIKKAEKLMYIDKNEHYEVSGHLRRER